MRPVHRVSGQPCRAVQQRPGLRVSAAVQSSVMGAQHLTGMLGAAITTAIHKGIGGGL